ncbi:prolyl hydroxylase family protein [Marinomonas pollencensis]|uniref:Putative 2-oxoglutarate/Fe(II)-dependent dioxygenase YbiX n=1 Tax=Marinomonas pollencensis TaxID=491954 RepID=A0A3E0DSP5_9GAMM|nr:2OG-Fe(II) oxygenase [Marinomonas pollencensis]REG86553.1 putative 2-oxoglutarate/Fe(II)-dependent dioxygenase YbiX [Marinomonas pollencensis]
MKQINPEDFFVAAYESGRVSQRLPLWGSASDNPLSLASGSSNQIERKEIAGVPGAFQLLNVFSEEECKAFIQATETMGYTEDAAVSLGRNVRHNMNLNWIIDEVTERTIWQRISPFLAKEAAQLERAALGLNQRCRFYRYQSGDFFGIHTDGAWPGSRIINGQPVVDSFGDRYSLYTCLIFLSEDFSGGETQFLVDQDDPSLPARKLKNAQQVEVRTPVGGLLFFPHGSHPLHCLHGSTIITEGVKYIIRSDVLFAL